MVLGESYETPPKVDRGEMLDLGRQAPGSKGMEACPSPPISLQFSRSLMEGSGRVGRWHGPILLTWTLRPIRKFTVWERAARTPGQQYSHFGYEAQKSKGSQGGPLSQNFIERWLYHGPTGSFPSGGITFLQRKMMSPHHRPEALGSTPAVACRPQGSR